MGNTLTSLAFFAGVLAVGVPLAAALLNQLRKFQTSGDHLVLRVDGQEFVIDVGALEHTDLETIDSATRAVEQRARIAA